MVNVLYFLLDSSQRARHCCNKVSAVRRSCTPTGLPVLDVGCTSPIVGHLHVFSLRIGFCGRISKSFWREHDVQDISALCIHGLRCPENIECRWTPACPDARGYAKIERELERLRTVDRGVAERIRTQSNLASCRKRGIRRRKMEQAFVEDASRTSSEFCRSLNFR